jgi:hypothetical protein
MTTSTITRDRSSTAERPFGGGGESKSSGLTGPTHGPIMYARDPSFSPFPTGPRRPSPAPASSLRGPQLPERREA